MADGRPHKITFSDKSGGFFGALSSLLPVLSNAFNIGSAVASIGKTIYDAATGRGIKVRRVRGKGVGGNPLLLGAAATAIPYITKKIYELGQHKGNGVGGFMPPIDFIPVLGALVNKKMNQSGKGIAESAKNIFLSPQFLSLVDQEIKKQIKGQGLMLGPPRHYPY